MSINTISERSSEFNAWNDVDWGIARNRVRKMQYRIYEARKAGKIAQLHWLQNKLINSIYAKLLAVQLVTTLNKGRNTAGVDKKVIRSPQDKLLLSKNLQLNGRSLPIRRVWIDKPGKTEKRPLGIPTIEDRAKQALAKLALEPEWEAVFEAGSYGFRPGRSCHDAIEKIFISLRHGVPKYVYDADIRKCFDQIDHDALLEKLGTFPAMRRQIRAWLKAGVMEGYANTPKTGEITETNEGTPQGGIVSPLLANIALHGLELHLKECVGKIPGLPQPGANRGVAAKTKALTVVRYADDFVLIHRNKDILEICISETKQWLSQIGLTINEEKSKLRDGREGFNFLGFRIILVRRKSGLYKVKIYPSRDSQARILRRIRKIVQDHKAVSSYSLILMLRPVIIGWANYFRYCECTETFSKITHLIIQKVRAWVFRRDTRSGRLAIKEKYFPTGNTYFYDGSKHRDNWILVGRFKTKSCKVQTNFLPHMVWVKSKKHVMVKENNSPFDQSLSLYWTTRNEKHSPFSKRVSTLLRKQKSICSICKVKFDVFDSQNWEVDHIVPRAHGGKDEYSNLQLIHRACHVAKTSMQLRAASNL